MKEDVGVGEGGEVMKGNYEKKAYETMLRCGGGHIEYVGGGERGRRYSIKYIINGPHTYYNVNAP